MLNKNEKSIVKAFLRIHMSDKIRKYESERYDFDECYEIGFMFSHILLRGGKIDPDVSPWGDGKSVIFDPDFEKLLLGIKTDSTDPEVNDFCSVFLELLSVFKPHFE